MTVTRKGGRPKKNAALLSEAMLAQRARRKEASKVKAVEKRREQQVIAAVDRITLKPPPHKDDKEAQKTLKELLSGERIRAAKVVVSIMVRSRNEELRFAAAKWLFDRTDGPIPKAMEVGGKEGSPIEVRDHRPTVAELLGRSLPMPVDDEGEDIVDVDPIRDIEP